MLSNNLLYAQHCKKFKIIVLDSITNRPLKNTAIQSRYFNGNHMTNRKGECTFKDKSQTLTRYPKLTFSVFNAMYFYKHSVEVKLDNNCIFIIYLTPNPNWKEALKEVI